MLNNKMPHPKGIRAKAAVDRPLSGQNDGTQQIQRMMRTQPQKAARKKTDALRVIITGSTKGLGLALAKEFAESGDKVVISSRNQQRVKSVVKDFRNEYGSANVIGMACDVGKKNQADRLAQTTVAAFGGVDIWICNAGTNAYMYSPLADQSHDELEEIVNTNTLGTLLSLKAAVQTMQKHPPLKGKGHVFLMEGAGSDGNPTSKFAAYGYTKAGIQQLKNSVSDETKDSRVTIHTISPGLVFTELVSSGQHAFGSTGRFFMNALASPPEDVAKVIVPKVRRTVKSSQICEKTQSSRIELLKPIDAVSRVLQRVVLGRNRGRFYPE